MKELFGQQIISPVNHNEKRPDSGKKSNLPGITPKEQIEDESNAALIEKINKKSKEAVFEEIDEIIYELEQLTESEKAEDHYQAADILKNLAPGQEKALVENLKTNQELLKKLEKINVPEFGRQPKNIKEPDDSIYKEVKQELMRRKIQKGEKPEFGRQIAISDFAENEREEIFRSDIINKKTLSDQSRRYNPEEAEKVVFSYNENSETGPVFEMSGSTDEDGFFPTEDAVEKNSPTEDIEGAFPYKENSPAGPVFEMSTEKDEGWFLTREKQKTSKIESPSISDELQKIKIELRHDKAIEIENAFQKNFGIGAKDLKSVGGFEELSDGQKKFILENLRQITLGKVKDGGEIAYEEKTKKIARGKKGLGKIGALAMNNLLKNFKIAGEEKKLAEELMVGGMPEHGEILRALVEGMKDGPEVLEKNGELEIQFASLEKWPDENERKIAENLNSAAAEFMRLPKEWGYKGKEPEKIGKIEKVLNTKLWGAHSQQENREKYEEVKKRYETARAEYLELEKIWFDEKFACQDVNSIDAKIQLNQLLNQNPEAEKELLAISSQSKFSKGLMNTLKGSKGRGISMGAGFAARSLAIGAAGTVGSLIAAPVVGGALGAWRGHKLAKNKLEMQDKQARRGEGIVDEKTKNFVPAAHLIKRLSDLSLECEQLKDSNQPAKFGQSVMSLKARIDYTQEKIDDGLVDFGAVEDYSETSRREQNEKYSASEKREGVIGRQLQLIQGLSQAKALVEEINLKANDKILEERLGRMLERRGENIAENRKKYVSKETWKTARNAAGFAIAGWMIRDVVGENFGWDKGEGSFLKKSFGKVKEFIKGNSGIEASPAPISIPEDLPDNFIDKTVSAETMVEAQKYFGGNSIWKEAENQIAAWRGISGRMPIEDIDKVKDLIVENPGEYGLPADIDFNDMSAEQIKNINWEKALSDANLNREIPVEITEPQIDETPAPEDQPIENPSEIKIEPEIAAEVEPETTESLKKLDEILNNSEKIRTDAIRDLPPTEETIVSAGSPEHLKIFLNDREAQIRLATISAKAKEYFNSQNVLADRQAAWTKVMQFKEPIEKEFGGRIGINSKGDIEINFPDGSSKKIFDAEKPFSLNKIAEKITAAEDGRENLNAEKLRNLNPEQAKTLTETSRQLSVLADNLRRLPPDSRQAAPIRKTITAIINYNERKFGQGIFNDDLKELAGLKPSKTAFIRPEFEETDITETLRDFEQKIEELKNTPLLNNATFMKKISEGYKIGLNENSPEAREILGQAKIQTESWGKGDLDIAGNKNGSIFVKLPDNSGYKMIYKGGENSGLVNDDRIYHPQKPSNIKITQNTPGTQAYRLKRLAIEEEVASIDA